MKFFRNLPIVIQQLIIMGLVTLAIAAAAMFTYSRISELIVNGNIKYTQELVYQLKQNISTNYNEICTLLTNVGYDQTVQDFMIETDPYSRMTLSQKATSILNIVKNVKTDLLDIQIIGMHDSIMSLHGGSSYAYQFRDQTEPNSKIHCSEFVQIYFNQTENCFLFGTHVFSINKNKLLGERIGFVAAFVNAAAINSQIVRMPKLTGTEVYLVDKNNMIFSEDGLINLDESPALKDIDMDYPNPVTRDVNGVKCIIQLFTLPEMEGKIVTIVPINELFSELSEIKRSNLIGFVVAFVLISIPLIIVMMNIVTPLKKLMGFMHFIKSGNLKALKKRISLEGYAEISVMADEFNNMLDEINGLAHRLLDSNTRLYKIELEKKQSELAFLQSQINPHFLYNTLESIRGIASAAGVEEIKDMTGALIHIFRYSIKGTEEVSLSEEIEIVKSFVKIQQIRFRNRFDIDYIIDPYTLECKVPKMILQPIIENAIYHGLEPISRKGSLILKCAVEAGNELFISVKDNGVGIEPSMLDTLRTELSMISKTEWAHGRSSIGIVNVNNRLKLIYGEHYGVSIITGVDEGTEVILRIPDTGEKRG